MAAEMEFFYHRPTSTAYKLNKILTSSYQSPQDDYCLQYTSHHHTSGVSCIYGVASARIFLSLETKGKVTGV